MALTNGGPSARDRRSRLASVSRSWRRAALVSAAVAGVAVTLRACGGTGSRADLGTAAVTATAANGTATMTGPGAGSPAAPGIAQINESSAPAAGASAPSANANIPASSAGVPGADGTTAPPSTHSAPTTSAAPSASSNDSGESRATLPAGVQGLSCPLPGPPSGRVNSFGWGQAIPAGFQPVAAVQCVPVGSTPPPIGQLPFVHEEVAVSGLGPLLAALLEPSGTPGDSSSVPRCLAPAADVFQLALIGADGQVIEPLIPVTSCGGPIQPVVASIAGLAWTTVN